MSDIPPRVHIQTVHHKADAALPVFSRYFSPIQVGGRPESGGLGIARDDTGDNIASKNASYCELTAMYWAWKNVRADFYGLMHYRRIFSARAGCSAHRLHMIREHWRGVRECLRYDELGTLWPANRVVKTTAELEEECRELHAFFTRDRLDWDVLLPQPVRSRKLSMAKQYAICNCQCDYDVMLDCIRELYPAMEQAAAEASISRVFSLYNMHVMRKSIFEDFAACLFGLLAEVERRVALTHRTPYQRRVFGFLAERFTNIYMRHLRTRERVRVMELPTVFLDLP